VHIEPNSTSEHAVLAVGNFNNSRLAAVKPNYREQLFELHQKMKNMNNKYSKRADKFLFGPDVEYQKTNPSPPLERIEPPFFVPRRR
jgi:hypothetical protein